MLSEIRNGVDQHSATCVNLMELPLTKENRFDAKIYNFRAIYCNQQTAWYGYFMDNKMPAFSQKKWKGIVEGFFEKYAGLTAWHKELVNTVYKCGELIGPTGRRWNFKKYPKKDGSFDYSVGEIYNYPVQGMSGDIIKLATVVARNRLRHINPDLIMLVHDSQIWDVPDSISEEVYTVCLQVFNDIPQLLKKYFNINFNVPICGEAAIGKSWGTVKEI